MWPRAPGNIFLPSALLQKNEKEKAKNEKMHSGKMEETGWRNGTISINKKLYSVAQFYNVLFSAGGLKSTIPLKVRLDGELTYYDVDWNPHNLRTGQMYPFKWSDVNCVVTSNYKFADNNSCVYIHVQNTEPGVGENIIKDILTKVFDKFYVQPSVNFRVFTTVLQQGSFVWNNHGLRPNRNLDTIYISELQKNTIINRLEKFYNSRAMYEKYCVPYKRIHLFHGEPGTGKTSTIIALATHFNKHIAKLTITPQVNSQHIEHLFKSITPETFLILEDVDSLFTSRNASAGTGFDFSTLLNCMDGITTVSSLVIFMTTNHITKLDPAFMRPGRIDMSVEFSAPNREVLSDCLVSLGAQYSHEHTLFLDTFGDQIKSIATLQKHLFDCIMDESPTIMNF